MGLKVALQSLRGKVAAFFCGLGNYRKNNIFLSFYYVAKSRIGGESVALGGICCLVKRQSADERQSDDERIDAILADKGTRRRTCPIGQRCVLCTMWDF